MDGVWPAQLIDNPAAILDASSRADWEEIAHRYPYFALAKAAVAAHYARENHWRTDEAIQAAALHMPDRWVLYKIIQSAKLSTKPLVAQRLPENNAEAAPKIQIEADRCSGSASMDHQQATVRANNGNEEHLAPGGDEKAPHVSIYTNHFQETVQEVLIAQNQGSDNRSQTPIEQMQEIALNNAIVQHQSKSANQASTTEDVPRDQSKHPIGRHVKEEPLQLSFTDWLKKLQKQTAQENEITSEGVQSNSKPPLPLHDKASLIDRFIATEPRISAAKKEFFKPENMARKSIQDESLLVSETLAQIFASQGNWTKAIEVYEKLQLTKPEKSAYFASLILELKQKS